MYLLQILRNIVRKCLIKSKDLQAQVVAFPDLGTGNLCYPADVVAEVMIKTVAEHISENLTSTCIKMVKMVIYTDSDYQQFCHTLFQLNRSTTFATNGKTVSSLTISPPFSQPKPSTVSNYHPNIVESQVVGNITVEIIVGDITDDDSDVIVNPTNDKMDLRSSSVSNAILNKAGPDLQKRCDSITSQGYHPHPDKVCCTRAGGNLKCKNVFHILVCDTDIAKAVSVCLEGAETSKLSSIAFPAIGTGALGHNLASAAQSMCESIVKFGQKDLLFVNQVRVIVFRQSMILGFIDHLSSQVQAVNKLQTTSSQAQDMNKLQKASSQVQAVNNTSLTTLSQAQAVNDKLQMTWKPQAVASIKHAINKMHSIFCKQKSSGPSSSCSNIAATTQTITNKSVLVLQVFSDDIKKIQKAEKRLQQLMEDQLSTDVIEDKLINQLSRKEHVDIKNRAKIKNIEIKINIGRFQHNIQLRGDREDIAELKKEIAEVLNEKGIKDLKNKEKQSVNAKVQWQWCNNSGVYENYDINANYAIEQAYQTNKAKKFVYKNQQSVTEDTVDDDMTDYNVLSEEFDFQQMKAKDLNDPSVVYDIKRNDIDHSKLVYLAYGVYSTLYSALHV